MKILWLAHMIPYPPKGGSLQRSFNLLKQLANRHEVHLLAFNQRAIHPRPENVRSSLEALGEYCHSVGSFEILSERHRAVRMAVLGSNVFSSLPYSAQMLDHAPMAHAVRECVRRASIDVVHFDAIELAPMIPVTNSALRILNHHNVESQLLQRRAGVVTNRIVAKYMQYQAAKLRTYEARVAPEFVAHLTVSEDDKTLLQKIAPGARVEVIPNGVDTEYFSPGTTDRDPHHILFVGGMTWFPNRDAVTYFLDAVWPLVKSRLPEARFTVVGRTAGYSLDRAGVEFTGFVDDVRPYFHSAAAMVIPIRVGGGTRLKILDAMAAGSPLVSTSIGCEGIAVTPEKDILIGDTPAALADQIVRLCQDAELRNSLASHGRALVESKYAWPLIGNVYDDVLQSVLSRTT